MSSEKLRATATVMMAGAMAAALLAQDPTRRPDKLRKSPRFIDAVESVRQLKPTNETEQAKARFYDRFGGDLIRPGEHVRVGGGLPVPPRAGIVSPSYETFIDKLICSSESAVVGISTPARVRMNNRETFLFTEQVIEVETWLRPAPAGPPTVEVLTSGGRVRIGNKLTVLDDGQELLPGDRYLLFLKRVPGTAAFAVVGAPIASGSSWARALSSPNLPEALRSNSLSLDQFIQDLIRASSKCSAKAL